MRGCGSKNKAKATPTETETETQKLFHDKSHSKKTKPAETIVLFLLQVFHECIILKKKMVRQKAEEEN